MKPLEEKLKAEADAIEALKKKLKAKEEIYAKTKAAILARDRKAENHRKLQNGGEIEKWLGADCTVSRIATVAQTTLKIEELLGRKLAESDVKKLELFLQKQEDNGFYFSNAMNGGENQGV